MWFPADGSKQKSGKLGAKGPPDHLHHAESYRQHREEHEGEQRGSSADSCSLQQVWEDTREENTSGLYVLQVVCNPLDKDDDSTALYFICTDPTPAAQPPSASQMFPHTRSGVTGAPVCTGLGGCSHCCSCKKDGCIASGWELSTSFCKKISALPKHLH